MENNIKNNTRTVGVSMTTHNTYFMKVEIDNKIDDGDIDWEIIKNHLKHRPINGDSPFEVLKDRNNEFSLKKIDGDNRQPDVSLVYTTSKWRRDWSGDTINRDNPKQIIGNVVPKNTRSVLQFDTDDKRSCIDGRFVVTLYLSGLKKDMRKLWDEGKIDELSQFNIIPEKDFIEKRNKNYGEKVSLKESFNPKYFQLIYKRKGSKCSRVSLTNVEDYMSNNIKENYEDNLTDPFLEYLKDPESNCPPYVSFQSFPYDF